MRKYNASVATPERDGQRGQSLVMVALLFPVLLLMAALVIDLGYIYVSYQQLVAATNAAALAGGAAIPNPSGPTALSIAQTYSAFTGDLNNHPNLQHPSISSGLACVNPATYPNLGLPPCAVYPNNCSTSPGCNMIQVSQTAYVPTFFARMFGVNYVQISATAVASAKGIGAPPFHIMMVLDTTASMGTGTDSGCTQNGTSYTPEQCAQYGIQTLLTQLDPCYGVATNCTPGGQSGTVANPWDEVGLMVFPGLCSATGSGVTTGNCPTLPGPGGLTNTSANATYAPPDYACPSTAPPIANYNNNAEYLILGFQEDYRLSDTSGLNSSSNIFQSIGAGTNNCGVKTPGGKGTFYAGAIQAAQDYLTAYKTTNVTNVMIILSDGDATASASDMGGHVRQVDGPSAGATYPASAECTQAINAATYAKNQGTLIYSISYGSETSGCNTVSGDSGLTPCQTMQGMASLPLSQYFFSVPDSTVANGTVCPGAVPLTALNQVFSNIAGQLTVSRLVPTGDF